MTDSFSVAPFDLARIRHVGSGLDRPECVLALDRDHLMTADWRGGVVILDNRGRQRLILAEGELPAGGLKPNGIAIAEDGAVLLTHLSDTEGGVWRMEQSGAAAPWLLSVDGIDLPPTNFVHVDPVGRVWITVSTRIVPRTLSRSARIRDGFIVLVAGGTARIVADRIGFTNEAKVDPTGRWLYVNETFGRALTRYPILAGSELGAPETVAEFGKGTFPDGLEFDVAGGVWITSVFSNRLIRVDEPGRWSVLLEDRDDGYLDAVEREFAADELKHRPPETVPSRVLKNISSLAFGGPDRKTIYLGCLQGDRLARLQSPVAGAKPAHWARFAASG